MINMCLENGTMNIIIATPGPFTSDQRFSGYDKAQCQARAFGLVQNPSLLCVPGVFFFLPRELKAAHVVRFPRWHVVGCQK